MFFIADRMKIVPNLKKMSTKLYLLCIERSPWEKNPLNSNFDYTCILLHQYVL